MDLRSWIEMEDLCRRNLASEDWVPLYAAVTHLRGQRWKEGCAERVHVTVAIRLPSDHRNDALTLRWGDVHRSQQGPWVENGNYFSAGTFVDYRDGTVGNYPVLRQFRQAGATSELHVDQDLVLALGLLREEDTWCCPAEDYLEVVRVRSIGNEEGQIVEIRAEHLRDYLCARSSGLLLASYSSRRAVSRRSPAAWEGDAAAREVDGGRWKGHCTEIFEASDPTGGVMLVSGELWRNEWIGAGNRSIRVRGDRVESEVEFIVANDGTRAKGREVTEKYLYFDPRVILNILKTRGGHLGWYTEDTGAAGLASGSVHFGVNEWGRVVVLGKEPLQAFVWAGRRVAG